MSAWTEHLVACIRSACRLEVLSPKPGNVCPGFSFSDASVEDFLVSADAIAPVLAQTSELGVGPAIRRAVERTQEAVGHNTNLGIVLLLAPLAAVPEQVPLLDGTGAVCRGLTVDDSTEAYRAISLASPGGLADVKEQPVAQQPDIDLRECMRLAAARDLIAAQYVTDFRDVLQHGVWSLLHTEEWDEVGDQRLAWLAVNMLATRGDTLIRRKCGDAINYDVQRRALALLQTGWPHERLSQSHYDEFDAFLRDSEHRRNPGTTADMIAAVLFAVLRSGICRCDNDRLEFVRDRNVQSV